MEKTVQQSAPVAIIGGGPAGLMAAETLAAAGLAVTVYDRKPSLGRKFLMAGRGGLNLTHSEDRAAFITRYGTAAAQLGEALDRFSPDDLRAWSDGLGEPTFIGTSGRVFPKSFKASPLLRAWLARLEKLGVTFKLNMAWHGWDANNKLVFKDAADNIITVAAQATLLALGGASWPRLGSDGSWVPVLAQKNIPVTPLQPANCGFTVKWSDLFRARFAGQALKSVTLSFAGKKQQGDVMMTQTGIEGGPVYALSAALRDAITKNGAATLSCDLRPDVPLETLTQKFRDQSRPAALSFSNYLRKIGGLSPVAIGLLMERPARKDLRHYPAEKLAQLIKFLPLPLAAPSAIDRAISTAGGIAWTTLDNNYMLKAKPGVFAAGEMLDWEAPTGGYLLQACFATGACAADGIINYLSGRR